MIRKKEILLIITAISTISFASSQNKMDEKNKQDEQLLKLKIFSATKINNTAKATFINKDEENKQDDQLLKLKTFSATKINNTAKATFINKDEENKQDE